MRRWLGPLGLLVALSFAIRLPALLNASGTNSDAAIVGLQARHILHHEWSPFLWGSGYQTSADSTWAALCFLIFGKTPLVLMLSALVLHVALSVFAFALIARRASPWRALVAALPLVFVTACVHSYALYPPRQLALTLAFAALWVIDRADVARFPRVILAIGGLVAMLAWVADPYAMIFLPQAALFGGLVALRVGATFRARATASLSFLGGVLLGAVPLVRLWLHPRAQQGVATMSFAVLRHNAQLFWHQCLPWVLGTKVYRPLHVMDYVEWKMPAWYAWSARAAAVLLGLAILASAFLVIRRRVDRALGALFAVGAMTLTLNVASFFVSLMVMDHFSMRYLAASVLVLPFVLAPLVSHLRAPVGALVLAPYLGFAGAGGWLAHGDWARGPIPVRTDAGRGVVETRVLKALQDRHVEAAVADYWACYRLALVWREALPIAPYHAEQDRYPPYRAKLDAAHRIAYIHDRDRSFEDAEQATRELATGATIADRFTWDGFDVVVIDR